MTSYKDLGIKLTNSGLTITDKQALSSEALDELVNSCVFGSREARIMSRYIIGEIARQLGNIPSSIKNLYQARASGELKDDFTVPALNLRGLTYDVARGILRAAVKDNVGAIIFELAKSEMEYTSQSPEEYVAVITAASIKEGYRGPLFFQADHTQVKREAIAGEELRLKHHIESCIKAGFYNIDIDASTLVDLSKKEILDQQIANIDWTAKLLKFIRSIKHMGSVISIGGEIGHIGAKNSTVTEFEVFMRGLKDVIPEDVAGISKVSVQTGTSHGGVVKEDGSLGKMQVDFDLLKDITHAGKKYGVGGSVQHGASTLPVSELWRFPKNHTLEIHLATGWQNLIFDSKNFPGSLRSRIYHSILKAESQTKDSDAQRIYRERKRSWGKFKHEIWNIPHENKLKLSQEVEMLAKEVFTNLKVVDTKNLVTKYALNNNKKYTIEDYIGN